MTSAWWETRWLLFATAWTIAGLGALLLLWSIFRDRSRGRTRCPKCWYDLAGLVTQKTPSPWPITCPECGKKIEHEQQTRRTRRHWRPAALALAMMLAAYPIAQIRNARIFGPQRLAPIWIQAALWPTDETRHGIPHASVEAWQLSDTLRDIMTQIDMESPVGICDDLLARRLARAARTIDINIETRVYDFSSLWDSLRRDATWHTESEAVVLEADLPAYPHTSGWNPRRTKWEWIEREVSSLQQLLEESALFPFGEFNSFAQVVGSSVVFADSPENIARLDSCNQMLRRVILGGPGSREELPVPDDKVVVIRNIQGLVEWPDADEICLLLGEWDQQGELFEGPMNPDSVGLEYWACDGSKSLLVVCGTPKVQQQIDQKLSQLRAERAKELQRTPAE
ncbi:MAG: hypothetical protein HUU19_08350 [Phycisphaerales bacterium]|nr:hypothetical protein [Phycisphaerales bacterium]